MGGTSFYGFSMYGKLDNRLVYTVIVLFCIATNKLLKLLRQVSDCSVYYKYASAYTKRNSFL